MDPLKLKTIEFDPDDKALSTKSLYCYTKLHKL